MKIVKMAAIATMALTLFASCNKKDEPKKEVSKMTIRIDEAALRSLEAPVTDGTKTAFESIKVIVNDGEVVKTLKASEIAEAVGADGHTFAVLSKPTKVVVEANAYVADPEITALQGVAPVDGTYDPANAADKIAIFAKKIPLMGSTTTIGGPTTPSGSKDKIYTATVTPKPEVARIEVAGKIVGQPNATTNKNAFKNIDVEAVYMNNYLNKKADEDRYFTPSDGNTAFAGTPALKAEMNNEIIAGLKTKFEAKSVAAAYQIFPTKDRETDFDHIILKVKLQYDLGVVTNRTQEYEEGYVTIVKYKEKNAASIAKFEAGKIYKLDLADLNEYFKTDKDGNPDTPVTPDPEHDGANKLTVFVKSYEWKAINIVPDTGGFKK